MDLSDDSSRGSTSRSSKSSKSRNGSEKNTNSKAKSSKTNKSQISVSDEQIEQFCAITGSTNETARNLIEACHGNLEMAINMHMEEVSGNPVNAEAIEDYVRAPIPQKQEVLVEPGYEGYGFGFKGKRRVVKSVFDSFRNFEVETKIQESKLLNQNGQSLSAPSTSGPAKRTLEDIFRPPIDLMFKGNLQNARDKGVLVKRWLIVNIQNVSEFACQCLNRDVWSNPEVKEIIKENFLFLQLYMDSEEGQRYMNFYKIKQWPYVAVLDPRTGELMVEWNYTDCPTFITVLTEFVISSSWGDEAVVRSDTPEAKRRRVETVTILDATEDEQLQAAIKASLAENREPASEDESDNESESGGEWFDSESESRTSEPKKKKQAASSPPQPDTDMPDSHDWQRHLGPETDPSSSIIFRYPDGNKEQKSLPCSSSILAICKYVAAKGFPPDKFELMANFPKRLLLSLDASTTLKDAGLFPHDTVFVQAR